MRQYCNYFSDDPPMSELEINCLSDSLHLLIIYLPYQCHGNHNDCGEYMGKLLAITEDCTSSKLQKTKAKYF